MTVCISSGTVRFSETDASGRFHYASALMWAEDAEHALLRSLDLPVTRFPRRAVSATYERPLVDGQEYAVELDVERLGRTSLTWAWRVLAGGAVAVSGSHTVVHIDGSGRPAPVPDALRKLSQTGAGSSTSTDARGKTG